MFAILALSQDQNTLVIALLIPILGVLSPLLLARQINNNTTNQKNQDWDRQDKVAARAEKVAKKAEETAKLLIQRQISLDSKTDEVARLVAASTKKTNTQLDKIHGLVNSQMTAAIRSELAATRDTLALMSELIIHNEKAGIEPTTQVLAAFKGRESKVAELEDILRIREEADAASKLVNLGPQEVVIVNPDPVPVTDIKHEVIIKNPDPIPVTDTTPTK